MQALIFQNVLVGSQQNWHNGETHSFTLEHLSNGYHIVDNSDWTGRITRGWMHFAANGGAGSPPPPSPSKASASPTLITYADGSKARKEPTPVGSLYPGRPPDLPLYSCHQTCVALDNWYSRISEIRPWTAKDGM